MRYLRVRGADLPGQVGIDNENGQRVYDGREGYLCHGPYIFLDPGSYTCGFFIRRRELADSGSVIMDITSGGGESVLAVKEIKLGDLFFDIAGLVKIDFLIENRTENIEARIFVPSGICIELRELIIYSRLTSSWGAY